MHVELHALEAKAGDARLVPRRYRILSMWLQRYGIEAVLVLTWRVESGRRQGFGRVIARRCSLARVTARSRRIDLSRNMTLVTDIVRDCDTATGRVA